jgi:FkbM family methyltransferase
MIPNSVGSLKRFIRPFVPEPLFVYKQFLNAKRMASDKGIVLAGHGFFFDLTRGDRVLRIRKSHYVYLQHMIENFEYYLDSVVPLHMDGANLVDMSGPRYHKLKGFGQIPFLFPSHTEPYSTTEEYLDFAALKGGETVLDIGAYAGITSIIFAQLVGPTGHVYAVEPDATNFECAQINVKMAEDVMGLKNITLIRKAIWSHSKGLLFSNEGAMGSSAVAITGGLRGKEEIVPSMRLEDFFEEYGLTRADFVKIDIEGAEVEVLQSSASFLKSTKARLIVEPHFVDGVLSTDRCRGYLESAGFHVKVRGKVGESEPLIEAVL